MKIMMGALWLAALGAQAVGQLGIAILLGILGGLAAAAAAYDEVLEERKAASWRAEYPTYKY